MNEQINKQTKTKSKLPQCCLFANRLEKPCYSKIPTSDFGPETTSQVNSPRSLLVNSRLVTLFQGQSRLSKFYCNRASPVGSQISGIAATSILFLFVCLFVLCKQITNITNGNSIDKFQCKLKGSLHEKFGIRIKGVPKSIQRRNYRPG